MKLSRGDIIEDRYQVIHPLGAGTMGEVYLARQLEGDGDHVAIKILVEHHNDASLKRFEQEAHIMAKLRHPHIVSILDYGLFYDETPFIVMEYVHGESLAAHLTRHHTLTWQQSLEAILPIAEGLQALHEQGFVHRDLKPDNILCAHRKRLDIRLVDFGVARNTNKGEAFIITRAGALVGTPAYMSPEQLFGEEATPKSDLYALGVVWFELLTGTIPYDAKDIHELRRLIIEKVPVPNVPEGHPSLPEDLVDLLLDELLVFEIDARIDTASLIGRLEHLSQLAGDSSQRGPSLFDTLNDPPSVLKPVRLNRLGMSMRTTTDYVPRISRTNKDDHPIT